MTGEAGGERYEDAGSSPSMSGKLGTPAMSVASSTARREVPSVGDAAEVLDLHKYTRDFTERTCKGDKWVHV